MHKSLKIIPMTVLLSSTSLMASEGMFLSSGDLEQPTQNLVYSSSPILSMTKNGYVKDSEDNYLLGWNVNNVMELNSMNWNMKRENLSFVHTLDSNEPFMPTNILQSRFIFPLNDDIGVNHTHNWHIIGTDQNSHDIIGMFTRTAAVSLSLSLSIPDALSINRDGPGGPLLDVTNPLFFNFDANDYLMDVDGMPGPLTLYIQWDPAITTAINSFINISFGPIGLPESTRIEDTTFTSFEESQDGSMPSKIMSACVDEKGLFHTIYEDGNGQASFQLGYIKLNTDGDPSQIVELANLDEKTLLSLNTMLEPLTY